MQRRYAILDVFTDTPLSGNPLAVVLDAAGLDEPRMQAIAREFNLSETVFVLPPSNTVHGAALRIFTPTLELPFAGHPTVGTAVLMGIETAGPDAANREMVLVLEEGVGPVRCGVSLKGTDRGFAFFNLPRLAAEQPLLASRDAIAAAVGLTPGELGFENHQPSFFSAGLPYIFVPVRDLGVIAAAKVRPAPFAAAVGDSGAGLFLYCRNLAGGSHAFRARMFNPIAGMVEDPATGSAVAALTGVIRRFDGPLAGTHDYVVEQGVEMGRPSTIQLEIDVDGGQIEAARIGGNAVVVGRGTLAV